MMTRAKDYLKRIKQLDAMIISDIDAIATLEALATRTTPVLSSDRVQSSGSQQRMEDVVCKIVDLKAKISNDLDTLINLKDEARYLIQNYCDHDCIMLLTKRYLGVINPKTQETEYLTWEKIAVDMGYTYKWVSGGLHHRALKQLQVGLDDRKEQK